MKSRSIKIGLVLGAIGLRWVLLPSPLPPGWTRSDRIIITAPIFELPDHNGANTVIRSGIWEVKIPGYAAIEAGKEMRFSGNIQTEVLLGKVTKITMVNPTFEEVGKHPLNLGEWLLLEINRLGEWCQRRVQMSMPEPMAGLAAGILLGVKAELPQDFYQNLTKTGTTHVIAASGMNVMMAAGLLMAILRRVAKRSWAVGIGIGGIWGYVALAGGMASVVRAGVMASLILAAYFFGRPVAVKRIFWVSLAVMLLVHPLWLVDTGFQLSAAAMAGLLYLQPRLPRSDLRVLAEYLYPTLAASLATLPIILWKFGGISGWSIPANLLVLPAVPAVMLLTAVTVAVPEVGMVAYVPTAWMVGVIEFFGGL